MDEKKKKILLVEDDFDIAALYKTVLEKEGFIVEINNDGLEVSGHVVTFRPNLILLDILLPQKSGFEILEQLKNDPELKSIPVFVLTNLADEESFHKRAIDLGAHEFLTKADYTPQQIVDLIKQHFREHEE